uniref:Orfan n=1 Tax=Strongyloides stercoralis TaxID=6248 RepID=A0A0K0E1U3_STRER
MSNYTINSSVIDFYTSYPSQPTERNLYSIISTIFIFCTFILILIHIITTKKFTCNKHQLKNVVNSVEQLPTHKDKDFDLDVITIKDNGIFTSQKLNDMKDSSKITICDNDTSTQLTI